MPLTLNAGDALFALAHVAMTGLLDRGVDTVRFAHALRRFEETCIHLTEGQHSDIQFEARHDVTMDEYVAMIEGKTSALIILSAELGALIAGCNEETTKQYAAFGRDLGLAFQVRDDILGIWGKKATTGKSTTSDIATRKKTLPILYALERSKALRDLYAQPKNGPDIVPRTVELLNQNGARPFTEEQINYYTHRALQHLEMMQPDKGAYIAIGKLIKKLAARIT